MHGHDFHAAMRSELTPLDLLRRPVPYGDSQSTQLRWRKDEISARNVLPGRIVSIVSGPVTTEVTLEVANGLHIVSTITSNSAEALQLKEVGQAYGIVKSSSVMIGTD